MNPRVGPAGPPYRAGTLSYTRAALVTLFVYLLWGDFCFTAMETIVPSVLPIMLKNAGVSNTVISVIVGGIATFFNSLITPIVSYQSDRHRSRLGRRIPYLLWPTPFIMLFLALIPFAPDLAAWLDNATRWRQAMQHSPVPSLLLIMGLLVALFQMANMVVASIYYYLFNDVVPSHMLARFLGLFKVVGTLAGFFFNRYVFGLAESHTKYIFVGAALLYGASFLWMCVMVKEGEYAPAEASEVEGSWIASTRNYFRQCFERPYYVWFYIATALFSVSTASNAFRVFFFRENLHLSLDAIGRITAWSSAAVLVLFYPLGWLADAIKPIRMVMLSMLLLIPVYAASFFLMRTEASALFWLLAMTIPTTMFMVSGLPMYAELLPRAQYGQFCSAQALVNSLFLLAGNWLCGQYLDRVKDYRHSFTWSLMFFALSFLAMLKVYAGWKTHGGADHYQAPA